MTEDPSLSVVRFGDFEVDLRSRELRKRGVRIALQGRPLQVLEALIRTPGQLVTRETLRQELWGSDTFVDFEAGLNAAVRRLREALGDAADVPRFVETLPRRGYRFIAPVQGVGASALPSTQPAAPDPSLEPTISRSLAPALEHRTWRSWLPLAAAALVLPSIVAVVLLARRSEESPPLAPRIVPLTTTAGSEVTPTLSPDGEQVAFSWDGERQDVGDRDIWLKIIGGGQDIRRLTSGPDDDVVPSWSPDGRQIAFLRKPLGGSETAEAGVYVVSPLGGVPRKVGVAAEQPSQLSWSADSRFIAAISLRRRAANGSAEAGGLQLIALDGGHARPLTTPDNATYDMQPAFSADGRRLAYASCGKRTMAPCDVHVVNLDTDLRPSGQPLRLTRHRAAIHGIAWTPDGQSLVYGVSPFYLFGSGMGSQLWRVSGDGTRPPERIESSRMGAFAPASSAARNRVVFAQDRVDFDILRFVPPDGETPVVASSGADYGPSFSPDGRRIAFESSRSGEAEEIWLADPDGSNMVQLTGGPVDWRDEPRWRGSPVWSPDGSRIVFASRGDGGNPDLWTVDVDGGSLKRLTNDPLHDGPMTWSRDGRWLYYRQDRSDGRDIMRIAATGSVPERITRDGALYPVISPDGKTLFYSKTDRSSPLFAMPIGGVERQIVDCVRPRAITVTTSGLYYLGCGTDRVSLYRRDLATGNTQALGTVKAAGCCMGLTVSADGRTILFARTVAVGADLLLFEDFK
ncbi:Transcriptional regulatory protein YycF [Luteitalea pratensis]|uniref:Transcriptional regulatory protein YycF n=1 Tax=Luteitalea pratensis TaxID=1855912 RepID=A0A143PLP2_LUTPR|nr:winged helix-turn-helix domain-containing protein [Luteitalea pratensis]AMY09411.1 Transcriptional regulatory protein YycF [Luteitalea pratensis]